MTEEQESKPEPRLCRTCKHCDETSVTCRVSAPTLLDNGKAGWPVIELDGKGCSKHLIDGEVSINGIRVNELAEAVLRATDTIKKVIEVTRRLQGETEYPNPMAPYLKPLINPNPITFPSTLPPPPFPPYRITSGSSSGSYSGISTTAGTTLPVTAGMSDYISTADMQYAPDNVDRILANAQSNPDFIDDIKQILGDDDAKKIADELEKRVKARGTADTF